jgi:OOP family OmpA-OmpF porin
MWPATETRRRILPLMAGLVMSVLPASLASAQEMPTTEAIVTTLAGLEAASDLEAATLRQEALERIKAKADGIALKRPPLSRQLLKLPHVNIDVQFNPDTPVIRPESYRTLGRLADALTGPELTSLMFLVVGRTEATGRREINLTLSQRRAEAIRDALVMTFKVSPKRIFAVGLGEEQLQDANNPKAAALDGERADKSGDELDEVRLPGDAGLLVDAAEMGPDRRRRDAKHLGYFRNPADLDDREEHPQFAHRQLEGLRDDLGRRKCLDRSLVHEQRGDGVGDGVAAAFPDGQWQHMGDIGTRRIRGCRQRNASGADGRIAPRGGKKNCLEVGIRPGIVRCQPAAGGVQDTSVAQDHMRGGVGMQHLAIGIDEDHTGTHGVECLGERAGFDLLQVDNLGNHDGAPDVRRDQTHAPARVLIDDAVAPVAEHAKHRCLGRRLLQEDADELDQPLRFSPFAVEPRVEEFLVWHEVGGRSRFFDVGEKPDRGGRVQRDVFLEIKLPIIRGDPAVVEEHVAAVAGGIVPEDRRCFARNEGARLLQG